MRIEIVPIDSIFADPDNVRFHSDRNLDAIRASLRRFRQQKPIVVDENGIIRAGNGTIEAARSLGWTEIAITRTTLRDIEAAAYAIADNRTSELAEWDGRALVETLRSLQSEDFEIEATGFTGDDLDALFEKLGDEYLDGNADQQPGGEASLITCPKCGYPWSGNPG